MCKTVIEKLPEENPSGNEQQGKETEKTSQNISDFHEETEPQEYELEPDVKTPIEPTKTRSGITMKPRFDEEMFYY